MDIVQCRETLSEMQYKKSTKGILGASYINYSEIPLVHAVI